MAARRDDLRGLGPLRTSPFEDKEPVSSLRHHLSTRVERIERSEELPVRLLIVSCALGPPSFSLCSSSPSIRLVIAFLSIMSLAHVDVLFFEVCGTVVDWQ